MRLKYFTGNSNERYSSFTHKLSALYLFHSNNPNFITESNISKNLQNIPYIFMCVVEYEDLKQEMAFEKKLYNKVENRYAWVDV